MGGTPTPLPVPNPSAAAQSPGPASGPEPGPGGSGEHVDPRIPLFGKETVFETLSHNAAARALAQLAVDAKFDRGELTITIARENIVGACEAVKAEGYAFFEDLTAVDWYPQEPRMQLSYHILSMALKDRVRLAVRLDSADLTIDSITGLWPSANFYEREVFDLFGVKFSGHPGLTRIMMPTDWKGYPLRKDYPVEGYR